MRAGRRRRHRAQPRARRRRGGAPGGAGRRHPQLRGDGRLHPAARPVAPGQLPGGAPRRGARRAAGRRAGPRVHLLHRRPARRPRLRGPRPQGLLPQAPRPRRRLRRRRRARGRVAARRRGEGEGRGPGPARRPLAAGPGAPRGRRTEPRRPGSAQARLRPRAQGLAELGARRPGHGPGQALGLAEHLLLLQEPGRPAHPRLRGDGAGDERGARQARGGGERARLPVPRVERGLHHLRAPDVPGDQGPSDLPLGAGDHPRRHPRGPGGGRAHRHHRPDRGGAPGAGLPAVHRRLEPPVDGPGHRAHRPGPAPALPGPGVGQRPPRPPPVAHRAPAQEQAGLRPGQRPRGQAPHRPAAQRHRPGGAHLGRAHGQGAPRRGAQHPRPGRRLPRRAGDALQSLHAVPHRGALHLPRRPDEPPGGADDPRGSGEARLGSGGDPLA